MKSLFKFKTIIAICLLLFLTGCYLPQKYAVRDVSHYDFQEGDILLQHIPSYLCSVIADVTNSQYSHCGIVVFKRGSPYVLEAIGPVRYTSIKQWINRGFQGRFTQLRPKNLSSQQIKIVIQEAEKFLGRPYDIQYQLDEEKIYCSELVYKAFLRGCNIEIGEIEKLGSLNWEPHEDFIRYITGGEIPLERKMVTPESLIKNTQLEFIYSTFPPRVDEPLHDVRILKGTWEGEYTIKGLNKAMVTLRFTYDGKFKSGSIKMQEGTLVKIINVSVPYFSKTRNFTVNLVDERKIKAKLYVQIRDNGYKLIGTWQDDLGYNGIFSLRKVSL